MTYDPGTDSVTTENNLTSEEKESLQVGEAMEQAQESMLAGKYKDAQELEKAYAELEKKLGEKSEASTEEPEQESETVDEKPTTDFSANAEVISAANDEYFKNDGKLSEETMDKFSQMSSRDLVEAYMEVQKTMPKGDAQTTDDLTTATVNEIKNFAGGDAAYNNMVTWAADNLDPNSRAAFDDVVNRGNVDAIKLAVSGLKSQYENAMGYEGKMYSGKAAKANADVFRSQAELVAAMGDPRYSRDPAYRQDILEKLDRSDMNF